MIAHRKLGKIGVVLPSGFMKGAFQAGALKVLEENDVIPSYVVGVSVGAINGALFVSGDIDALVRTYKDIAEHPRKYLYGLSSYTLLKAFFWTDSILVNKPLRRVLRNRLNLQAVAASPITLEILTTDYQAGTGVIFSNKSPEHKSTDIRGTNSLMARSWRNRRCRTRLKKGVILFFLFSMMHREI
jgi:predicted acylesterase/phospholipase RssA